ncbi:hypothetical protein F0562_000417 [Nyssa sinensis]|uniref:Uncharacterized protein n=1 Tax=Nyssa sinensis TaxID=561372 RepID=A0A5J5BZZ3_9ASTE|nr:hypothetical protein F0562_000417 [Nyssa sinensis]
MDSYRPGRICRKSKERGIIRSHCWSELQIILTATDSNNFQLLNDKCKRYQHLKLVCIKDLPVEASKKTPGRDRPSPSPPKLSTIYIYTLGMVRDGSRRLHRAGRIRRRG